MKNFLVIGNPIEHSLSPKLHNYWIKINNLNAIYNKKKLEICMAISYLFQSHHMILSDNLHWYYNPHSNSIEPIFREVFPVKPSGSAAQFLH